VQLFLKLLRLTINTNTKAHSNIWLLVVFKMVCVTTMNSIKIQTVMLKYSLFSLMFYV